jgi:predicted DNA binding CopG/RHH family protein
MRRFEVRLPEPTIARLTAEAQRQGMPLAAYVRALLVQPSLFDAPPRLAKAKKRGRK